MSFNLKMTVALLGMTLWGCGWVGEKAPPKEELTIDTHLSSSPSCQIYFDEIQDHFEKGALKEQEIEKTVECALTTLREVDQRIEPAEKGVLTRREIEALLHSKIFGDPQKLSLWIDRLFSARDLLFGGGSDKIHFSEIQGILTRVKMASQKIRLLSETSFSYRQNSPTEDLYWDLRKKLFSAYVDLVRMVLQDHALLKEHLLDQYRLWEGLEEEVGSHYIKAGYLANRIFFGESETIVRSEQLPQVLNYLVSVYHLVTDINRHLSREIWTSKESLSFLYTYQALFETLLKVFFERKILEMKKQDLIPFLELLHAGNGGKAQEFMEAVFEFKQYIFGGNSEALKQNEIEELLSIFNESLQIYEKSSAIFSEGISEINERELAAWLTANEKKLPAKLKQQFQQTVLDFSKILYLWTTPFQRTGVIRKHPFMLTQTAFVPIDRVISAYDRNGDGKLSTIPFGTSTPPEMGNIELTSFLETLQKLLKGLDLLIDGDARQDRKGRHRIWTDPLDVDSMTLGKHLVILSDQLLYTSNGDQTLDRHEIIEATSFILENHRAVSWFYWDPDVLPFHQPFPDSKGVGLRRSNLLESLKKVATLQWYFPMAMKTLSEADIKRYIGTIIEAIGRDHPTILSVKELAVIFLIVRMIENLFLRFDENQNGILNKGEIRQMYQHFSPMIQKLVNEYNNQPGAFEKIPVFGSVGRFLSLFFNKFLTPFVSQEEIYRRAFEYSLSHGKLPESTADLFFPSSKIQSDRLKVVSLITDVMKLAIERQNRLN